MTHLARYKRNFLLISDKQNHCPCLYKIQASHTNVKEFDGKTYKLRETPQCIEYQVYIVMYKWRLGNQAGTVKSSIYGQSAAKLLKGRPFKTHKKKVQRLNVSW